MACLRSASSRLGALTLARRTLGPSSSLLLSATSRCRHVPLSPLLAPFSTSSIRLEATTPQAPPATAQAESSMRRFWKSVGVTRDQETEGFLIRLDGRRPLRTPDGQALLIPKDRPLLAALIAREWNEQKTILKAHALPFTSLAARAIDGLATPSQRSKVCDDLLKYLETDTICFHEDAPHQLVRLQKEHWDPILAWAREKYSIELQTFDGLLGASQSEATLRVLRERISTLDAWELAAFERAVLTTKSFLVGLRIVDNVHEQLLSSSAAEGGVDFATERASLATEVEVASQIERWGEVEDTHDVDKVELRAKLGSVVLSLVRNEEAELADAVSPSSAAA